MEVSEIEKKKDISAKISNVIIVVGRENIKFIFGFDN